MPRTAVWGARLALIAIEVVLIRQYVVRGTAWHGLVHSFLGLGAGLAVAALVSAGTGRPTRGLGWAAAGQLVSVTPDLLYSLGDVPHRSWMDLFAGHLAVHTAWAPLLLTFGFFLAAGWAWWLASGAGFVRTGAVLALGAAAVVVVALVRADPVPSRLVDFRTAGGDPPTVAAPVLRR